MNQKPRTITYHVGGPRFHPVDDQARLIQTWVGDRFEHRIFDGIDAFEHLEDTDLLVLMGLHWTGMTAEWCGKLTYRPMTDAHKKALEAYVASGKPILVHHGACASYNDWTRFGTLLGVRWVWDATTHSPFGTYTMRALPTGHPIVAGVNEYTIEDEIYYALDLNADMKSTVHAVVEWDGLPRPMVITAEGGRIPGAGKMVYLANGHDMKAMQCPALKQLWINSVNWLLG